MHRRERLDDKQFRHADAPRNGHPANVVTHQIDDHQVFGAVFWRGGEFFCLLAVGVGIGKAWQRALNRAGLNGPLGQVNKALGRQAEDRHLVQTDKRAERRLVAGIKTGKRLPLISPIGRLEALGEVNLVAVAALQIRLNAREFFAILRGAHVRAPAGGQRERLCGCSLLRLKPVQTRLDVTMAQQGNRFFQVIDD